MLPINQSINQSISRIFFVIFVALSLLLTTFFLTACNITWNESLLAWMEEQRAKYEEYKENSKVRVTGVMLDKNKAWGDHNEAIQLSATVEPSNAYNKNITWESSNPSIAEVDTRGLVTIKSSTLWESATITAKTEDGSITATCDVTVIGKPTANPVDADDFVTISAGSMPLNNDGSYQVTLIRAFKICKHEVTQKEWMNVMGSCLCYFGGSSGREAAENEVQENRPMEFINWYDAIAYCNKRTEKENIKRGSSTNIDYVYFSDESFTTAYTTTDASSSVTPHMRVDANGKIDAKGYRLPTEVEWEIAARGGLTGDVYAGTDDVNQLSTYAWYNGNSDGKTHEVKKKSANAYGLYDMSGNVLELCWDLHGDYSPSATDPIGATTGSYRIGRGGAWNQPNGVGNWWSVSNRYKVGMTYKGSYVGFRVCRSAE